jgi:nitric oxide reductase NorD protein
MGNVTSTPENQHVMTELLKHPAALMAAYEGATEEVAKAVGPQSALKWAEEGARIAGQGPRAWEAATEYFKSSPAVVDTIGFPQFERWVESGIELTQESPVVAASYFRASPEVLPTLAPRHIAGWAGLGRSLSKGTWKSSSLAARFFDVSADLVQNVNFHEMQLFVTLVQTLSNRSYDLAAEALVLGQRVLPAVTEREELISLATVLADTSWREVRGSFEAAARVGVSVDHTLRRRYFALTERLARMGMPNVSTFMLETAHSLARLPQEEQMTVLERAEDLADTSAEAVGAFLRTAPTVLTRISTVQLDTWFQQGVDFLRENPDGGVAYFKLESLRAEALLESLSSSIELEKVRGTLGMYANALAGSTVELQPVTDLTHKNIGWVSVELATTDGSHVYLPPMVDHAETKGENFSWLKVVTTHQIGHLEFESFDFEFETSAARFNDLRQRVAEGLDARPGTTDIASFFDLFPVRSLANDVFSVVEDARVDHALIARYRGLEAHYRKVQAEALDGRPQIESMPAQQAMVELLIRLSLHHTQDVPVPTQYMQQARELAALLRQVQDFEASVEDTAEATLRIYHLISQLPNDEIPPDDWENTDLEDTEFSEPDAQTVVDNLRQQFEDSEEQKSEEYESPEDVEYRGDFKPEMVQLLEKMRGQPGASDDEGEDSQAISQEELEQMLRDSSEVEMGDDAEVSTVAANMMKEAGADSPDNPSGHGYNQIPHQDEEGGPLEPLEPRSFVYDEWDFRANDYRPRWCIVQERTAMAGEAVFFTETLQQYAGLMDQIRRQFESIRPEMYRKQKRLSEGEDIDLDAAIEALIDIRNNITPDERVYWRRNKDERDVAVAFLLDMSASTAEAVEEGARDGDWSVPGDPVAYTAWLRTRRGETGRRPYKRIIDVEKESMVLLMTALEAIGDRYGVYGFSGFGRENVEFYVIKEVEEALTDRVKRRLDKVAPLHATRMGPAIRHAATKLAQVDAKTKFMFVVSDGRPQDRGYSREGVEKEYAVQDTRMALIEAKQMDITPFCLTVDRNGHDYLRTMAGDLGYEVLPDITELPRRLPQLYRKVTL